MKWSTLVCMTASLGGALTFASVASAQDNDTEKPEPKRAAPAPAPAAAPVDDTTDHEKVVGHLGVGYFGVSSVPLATEGGGTTTVNAPVLGVRYWLSDQLGIDGGIGFWTSSTSGTTVAGSTTTTVNGPSAYAFLIHGGVPLSLVSGKHYSFQIVPELNLGFSSQTIKGTGNNPPPDIDLSGFRFDLGARVGGEIQFGFIGIPELSLQAYVGLYIQRESVKESQGNNSISGGTTQFSTLYDGANPWSIFANSVAALYYF